MGLGSMKEQVPWDAIKTVAGTTKLLAVAVCLGHVVMWVVMPTRMYLDRWLVGIMAKTTPTYFGKMGSNALLFTFPVVFVATVACVYLHLRSKLDKNSDHSNKRSETSKNSWVDSWRRPALTKGLLGIVSWVELAFFVMFIALLVWFFFSYQHYYSPYVASFGARKGIELWQEKCYIIGYVLGLVGNVGMAFLFFPVTRGSSVLLLFGLTSESSIKYHIWVGHVVMVLFTAHGVFYVFTWASTNTLSEMLKWDRIWISNVAGEISLLAGLIMWVTCLTRIRRKIFELFFYTHYLYIVFMIFYVFHVGFPYICTSIGGFFLFLIDRYIRFLQSQQKIQLVSARVLPCRVLELNFNKSPRLCYSPTSILFVNVPSISKLQWHPFTISSSSSLDPEKVSIVVKTEGTWSHELYKKLSSGNSPSSVERLEIALEGPYGPSSKDYLRHDMLVMVSGGSGITSFISIIRDLLFTASTTNTKTPKLLLVCAFKTSQDLAMLDLILPDSGSGASFTASILNLQIEAYVTRDKEPKSDHNNNVVQTIWFKPSSSDSPLGPVLGSDNWLWLGGVIASSFVMFLLLVGVFTQYYIYPVDHNTDEHYSNAARSAFYMFFMCVSVALASSAAFLWNKRQHMKEVQNIIGPKQTSDRELESLPCQSLAQAINVSYGTRPDLKRLLLEIEEPSVLVLASGPRKLRQDVAKICSSGLADNLHFESISFSW